MTVCPLPLAFIQQVRRRVAKQLQTGSGLDSTPRKAQGSLARSVFVLGHADVRTDEWIMGTVACFHVTACTKRGQHAFDVSRDSVSPLYENAPAGRMNKAGTGKVDELSVQALPCKARDPFSLLSKPPADQAVQPAPKKGEDLASVSWAYTDLCRQHARHVHVYGGTNTGLAQPGDQE